ncbi:putative F-box associated interaction domain-containing protein [Medicago truncatula]|uniref:Putative F-box associated interaction domain-containing protein n=2 Tax=Medicago truncatula TaxID=3880 RepID=A0A396II45_MEDTR|nr:putative F-box associated interaction domain-containing protein [Medicago truncatula]
MYGFGYDVDNKNYKVVVVSHLRDSSGNFVEKDKVMVHTLGTNAWESIQKFPFYCGPHQRGTFVSGMINWLVYKGSHLCIASFDLGNKSNQEVSLLAYVEVYAYPFGLGVLRDCLCMIIGHDVWVMKEHGNKESWTKLFTISYLPITYIIIDIVNIFEENQVLLKCTGKYGTRKWIIYNSINGTFACTRLENALEVEVCVESLISPYWF